MFLPWGDVKWRKVRQAHYHSTTYIKCYGNIIHFISSYTFPQTSCVWTRCKIFGARSRLPVQKRVCVCICMCTYDASIRAGRGEMCLWSYLANAAASDKSFISLILRERPCRPCRTPPLQIYPAGKTQRPNSPSLVAHPLLPSSLPHPKPFRHPHLFALPPSSGHSRQYVSLTLANQRFTLDAQMQ